MKYTAAIAVALALASCSYDNEGQDPNSGSVHAGARDTVVTSASPLVLEGCYAMIIGRDTATLQLNVRDTVVTGSLVYDWHEKDGNRGRLRGAVRDSLIRADYTFESEGLTSVREVVFRMEDSTLLQGYGELTDKEGKIVFTDPTHLRFDSVHPFLPIPCNNPPSPVNTPR